MSSEQDFLYQRKYAVSSDGGDAPQGAISAGGMYNKNTEWMQNSYTSVSWFSVQVLVLLSRQLLCSAGSLLPCILSRVVLGSCNRCKVDCCVYLSCALKGVRGRSAM